MNAVLVFLFFITSLLATPNLIGYSEEEIKQYMEENEKGFVFQSFTNNSTFKYLKYTDRRETQTILFFLDSELKCKLVRLVCEMSLKSSKLKELDSQYSKEGENIWKEVKNGISYIIELREEETTFNINIQRSDLN